jgi:hypothetical protein
MRGRAVILIIGVALLAVVAAVAGDFFGTPYLLRETTCVIGPETRMQRCRLPIDCTYLGIQGYRHFSGDRDPCSRIKFYSWNHGARAKTAFPSVSQQVPEQSE